MSDSLQSFLDDGTFFEGKLVFSGIVRIDGHFRGEASADGTMVVGEAGKVEAEIKVGTLIVEGRFRGKVEAKELVEVAAGGAIEGSVSTARLSIAEGAEVNATISMGGA